MKKIRHMKKLKLACDFRHLRSNSFHPNKHKSFWFILAQILVRDHLNILTIFIATDMGCGLLKTALKTKLDTISGMSKRAVSGGNAMDTRGLCIGYL